MKATILLHRPLHIPSGRAKSLSEQEKAAKRLSLFIESAKHHSNFTFNLLWLSPPSSEHNLIDKLFDSVEHVDEEIVGQRFISEKTFDRYRDRYSEFLLNRLQIPFGGANIFTESSEGFVRSVLRYAIHFEEYIKNNEIDIVLWTLRESYGHSAMPLMMTVCERVGVRHCFVSNIIQRISIREGIHTSSRPLHLDYKKRKATNLKKEEEVRIDAAISAFLEFKKSQRLRDRLYGEKSWNSSVTFHKGWYEKNRFIPYFIETTRNYLKDLLHGDAVNHVVKNVQYDKCDLSDGKYVLLLPNKESNYRLGFHAPFFSEMSFIIRSIAVALPLGYRLIVKGHPHSFAGEDGKLYRESKIFNNVFYIDPRTETFDVVENSLMVFSIASSSGFESLFKFKHLIVFGSEQYIFGGYEAPIKRVERMEDLPSIINECLKIAPNKNLIKKFLYSFFQHSHSLLGPHDDWCRFDLDDTAEEQSWSISGKVFAEYFS